jgi:hypothetical protein
VLTRLVLYLLVTWAVECAVAVALLKWWRSERAEKVLPLLRDAFLVNSLTNPLANYAVLVGRANFWLVEAVVIAAEIPLYRAVFGLTWQRAVLLSLFANALTLSLSFLF